MASRTWASKSGQRSQVMDVSNVSPMIPSATGVFRSTPMKLSLHAPTAPPRPVGSELSLTLTASSGTSPPAALARSRAAARAASWGSSADSNPTITRLWVPSRPAPVSASAGSRMRRLAGHSLAWTMDRTALVPRVPGREPHSGRGPEAGTGLHPHPGLRDDAEDPLAADHHAVGTGPRPAARQPARLPPSLRRQHAHRLDEVVDVGVVGGVVAAGPGGDPPAEGRPLEALGEVPEREAVGPELRLEVGPSAPAWIARRATISSTSRTLPSRRRSTVTTGCSTAGQVTPSTTDEPPP